MFRAWAFTEMPYPDVPDPDVLGPVRTVIPSSLFDPQKGYSLYRKYFGIYEKADELGLDIMLNEHHGTLTCLNSVAPLTMAVLARTTRKARLLVLGNPVANRADPVRVAEEMAFVDVLSAGRAEVGFVRGSPMEITPTNSQPVDLRDRFVEAMELITAAWKGTDGPFNWEGEHFHHRQVNIMPRPFQQPHPPIWETASSPGSAMGVAARGHTIATMMNGSEGCRAVFQAYREQRAAMGEAEVPLERLAYCACVYVGETDEEAQEAAAQLQWFPRQTARTPPQFVDIPGFLDAGVRATALRTRVEDPEANPYQRLGDLAEGPVEDLITGGYTFAGTAEAVFEQIRDFYRQVGGFGNLLMMVQSSDMSATSTEASMERFARRVLPRLRAEVFGR